MKKAKLYTPTVYAAFYPGGKVIPRYIHYRGITFKISRVMHSWKERIGEKTVFFFSVSDGINNLIVSYTTPDNTWKVEEIHQGIE